MLNNKSRNVPYTGIDTGMTFWNELLVEIIHIKLSDKIQIYFF